MAVWHTTRRYTDFKLRYFLYPGYLYTRIRSIRSAGDLARRLANLAILSGKLVTGRYGEKYWREKKRLLLENYGTMKEGSRDKNLHLEAARVFLDQKNYGDALQAFSKALSLGPDDAAVHLEIGKIHLLTGDFVQARQEFVLSYGLDPSDNDLAAWSKIINEVKEPRNSIPPYRIFLTWGMHYQCNFRCSYCHAPKPEDPNFSPDKKFHAVYPELPRLKEIWDGIAERYGSCRIRLDGGEPSLYPGFIELVRYLSGKHRVQINSNLSFDVERFSAEIDAQHVRFDASFHPECIPLKEFLKKTRTLKEKGFKVVVSAVAYPPLMGNMGEYKAAFEASGTHFVVHPYSGEYEGRMYPASYRKEEIEAIYAADKGSRDELEWRKDKPDEGMRRKADDTGDEGRQSAETLRLENSMPVPAPHREAPSPAGSNVPENGSAPGTPESVADRRCRMGHMYARIYPNGDAFRCCTDNGLLHLGNLYDGSFRLLDGPQPCAHTGCRCWRCMTVGEECRWVPTWVDEWEMPF